VPGKRKIILVFWIKRTATFIERVEFRIAAATLIIGRRRTAESIKQAHAKAVLSA
jgi:hypothetical protein